MSVISQISIVYNNAPFIVVDFDQVQSESGKEKEMIVPEELGAWIRIFEQQQSLLGQFISVSKSAYVQNNRAYPAIVFNSQSFIDPPITNYKSRTINIRNGSAQVLGVLPECGQFVANDVLQLAVGQTVQRRYNWMPDTLASDPEVPYLTAFVSTAAGMKLNDAGSVPLRAYLELDGQPILASDRVFDSGELITFDAYWKGAWDTIVFLEGAAPNQFTVRAAAVLLDICNVGTITNVFCADPAIIGGSALFTDDALTVPLPGNFVTIPDGRIFTLVGGVVTAFTGNSCTGGTFSEFSNAVVGGKRIQVGLIAGLVTEGANYNLEVYNHKVTYVAQAGDTITDVINNLVQLVNSTTNGQWNDHNSAPAVGTLGFPPLAAVADVNKIELSLNVANQFAFSLTYLP